MERSYIKLDPSALTWMPPIWAFRSFLSLSPT
jgi:hypothetical protein